MDQARSKSKKKLPPLSPQEVAADLDPFLEKLQHTLCQLQEQGLSDSQSEEFRVDPSINTLLPDQDATLTIGALFKAGVSKSIWTAIVDLHDDKRKWNSLCSGNGVHKIMLHNSPI
jgi:hypothetical protein